MKPISKATMLAACALTIALCGAGCDSSSDNGQNGGGAGSDAGQTQGQNPPALTPLPANQPTSGQPLTSGASSDVLPLYASDLAGMSSLNLEGLSNDNDLNQVFAEIFGGTDSSSVVSYFQARIHYAFTEDEMDESTTTPAYFANEGWLTTQGAGSELVADSNVQVGALNRSTLLWLEGVVNNTSVTLSIAGQVIPIVDTRTGVMVFGPGYASSVTDDSGDEIPIPAAYRQSILVHEARHSDCTDGLSANELRLMQNAASYADFAREIPLPHCGHTHVVCPSGTYQGLFACDVERYGAYTVGATYAKALVSAQTDEISFRIMQAVVSDNYSRYIGTPSSAPDENTPNMSSSGLTP